MSDMNSLNGSSVRDATGRTGRVVSVTEAAVNVAWMQKGLVAEEAVLERATLAGDLQVLTLKEGWQPLAVLAGVTIPKESSQLAQLAEELQSLFATSKPKLKLPLGEASEKKLKKKATLFGKKRHSPFKRFGRLGPGPGTGHGTREVGKKTRWDCTKTSAYNQTCTLLKRDAKKRLRRTKKTKKIRINPSYKSGYNKAYKAWRKKG
jgi:hypothetical protein